MGVGMQNDRGLVEGDDVVLSCIGFVWVRSKPLNLLHPRRLRSALSGAVVLLALLFSGPPARADETTNVVTNYELSIAGISLASFKFLSHLDSHGYSISGRGNSSRLVELIAKFSGSTKSDGIIDGPHVVPASYELLFLSGKRNQSVEMHFSKDTVDKLAVDPPQRPSPTRIPLLPAHQTGVLDPLSAVVLPMPQGEINGDSVCNRRLPIFDGRHRYDLVLSYKRTESAPVAGKPRAHTNLFVCKIKYNPIAGHKPDVTSTRYWQSSEDIEIWLAPITSAGLLVPYRAMMPTPVGVAVLALSKIKISKTQQQAAVSPAKQ
jgi:Protein of unknown function (DUF3108)